MPRLVIIESKVPMMLLQNYLGQIHAITETDTTADVGTYLDNLFGESCKVTKARLAKAGSERNTYFSRSSNFGVVGRLLLHQAKQLLKLIINIYEHRITNRRKEQLPAV